jgi:hypothetical protein
MLSYFLSIFIREKLVELENKAKKIKFVCNDEIKNFPKFGRSDLKKWRESVP